MKDSKVSDNVQLHTRIEETSTEKEVAKLVKSLLYVPWLQNTSLAQDVGAHCSCFLASLFKVGKARARSFLLIQW